MSFQNQSFIDFTSSISSASSNKANLRPSDIFSLFEKTASLQPNQIHLKKNEDILSLVAMTPYHWHLNTEKKALLAETHEFTTHVDFELSLFQKSFAAGK